ncbi:glycosyltransferase [Haloprofundus halobius]|uniref:glycosyltransferase n=1 Tax=Haloprofundus halobius TaxID=2876194 RepID=UPI001CCB47A2|nr:glycosyltransferase family 2 protein [Haloprofundus halobius]
MRVETPGGEDGRTVATAAAALGLSVALCSPVLVISWYGPLIAVLCVLVASGVTFRAVLATGVACLRNPDPPPLPADPPAVSVVVTAYNDADALRGTLDACAELDYPSDRVNVLVGYEAASTDGTVAAARRAAAADSRTRAVERSEPPAGKAAAVNHLLSHVDGDVDVVASLDAGQRLAPGSLSRAVRWLVADAETWCVKGRSYGRNADESLIALCATVERHLAERIMFVARSRLGWFSLFTGGQAFFRAETLAALGPFDEDVLLEDVEMSTRIHARGGRVRVDPSIVATERNPTTLSVWAGQRRRWARGGMQVARRSLTGLLRSPDAPVVTRLDAAYTFAALLSLPVVVLLSPVFLISPVVVPGSVATVELAASDSVLRWLSLSSLFSLSVPYALFLRDAVDGHHHGVREYAAPLVLPAYFALQSVVVLAAFLDEFVLRRPSVYVTSRLDE